MRYQRNLYIA